MLIARLIADTDAGETADLENRLNAAADAFAAEGMPLTSAAKLDFASSAIGGEVLQLSFAEGEPAKVLAGIDKFFAPTDAMVSAEEIIVPKLFVSDMDSTMIGQECIDELADFAGLKAEISDITERAMQGELDFESALRERVTLLARLDEAAIETCLAERIRATPGAKTLTATLGAMGTRCVLVTGGFHHFADAVAQELGFQRVVGNRLDVADGKLTGKLLGGITDASTKAAVLNEELEKLGPAAKTLATGDGANDIPMIEAAHYGFAYRAKPKARAAANGRVDRGDLSVILALLGIAPKDWVEG
uniref:phosphoserine phosphatase SerB n=1 Tax=uncultured Erythrobacter sp. TaxID=263913 RepID=UPI00262DD328|nr:phosphoserine phosphatase SerB [uncultured Erythrobacter sp.]